MGSLFKPRTPKIEPPARMPDADDPNIREQEAKKRREIAARSGRSSTILSRGTGSGTQAYGNSLLGQAG